METIDRDAAQDQLIKDNAARISRNEEAIRRQTAALESIRDHYYPPPAKPWRRMLDFVIKVVCVIVAYAGIGESLGWYLNVRKTNALAKQCAVVARRLFFQDGDAAGAARFYAKAVKLDDGNARYRIESAFVKNMAASAGLYGLGRPLTSNECAVVDEALAEATFLLEAEPDSPMPHVLAAQAYTSRGERDEAIASVDRAVQLAPDDAQVRVSACAMHFMNGDVAGARAQLAEAGRLNAKLPLCVCWKGMLALLADRDPTAAKGFFEEMTRLSPRLAVGHAMLGRALLASGSVPEARVAFGRALALDATQKHAILGMAESFEREKNFVMARLWLDRALSRDANCMDALVARARIDGALGDGAAAIRDLSAAVDLAPFRADLRETRAEAYARGGDEAHAKADRETAAALRADANHAT